MFRFNLLVLISSLLLGCADKDKNTLVVGTIAGPETALVEAAIPVAKERYGLTIKVKEFSDYLLPNIALSQGDIDANVYQHRPYLEKVIKARDYKIVSIGKTFIYPMAIYSNKLKQLNQLKENAIVAIPNDPSNEARALLLLQKAGLIKVSDGINASTHDIRENPKHLKIKTMDAAQLPRVLPDVDLAVINTTFALPFGLSPQTDGLFIESNDSPYVNLIVVREKDKNKKAYQELKKALQSQAVKDKAQKLFKGGALPAF